MKTLFDAPPYAHAKDPQTSFDAGQKMIESGKFHYSVEQVRRAIKRFCKAKMRLDFTAKEVARFISKEDGIEYFPLYITIQKRKSVLRNQAFIKETGTEREDCGVCKLI